MNIQVTDNQLIDSVIVGLDVKEYARAFSVSEKTVRIRIREKKVNCYFETYPRKKTGDSKNFPAIEN